MYNFLNHRLLGPMFPTLSVVPYYGRGQERKNETNVCQGKGKRNGQVIKFGGLLCEPVKDNSDGSVSLTFKLSWLPKKIIKSLHML